MKQKIKYLLPFIVSILMISCKSDFEKSKDLINKKVLEYYGTRKGISNTELKSISIQIDTINYYKAIDFKSDWLLKLIKFNNNYSATLLNLSEVQYNQNEKVKEYHSEMDKIKKRNDSLYQIINALLDSSKNVNSKDVANFYFVKTVVPLLKGDSTTTTFIFDKSLNIYLKY